MQLLSKAPFQDNFFFDVTVSQVVEDTHGDNTDEDDI